MSGNGSAPVSVNDGVALPLLELQFAGAGALLQAVHTHTRTLLRTRCCVNVTPASEACLGLVQQFPQPIKPRANVLRA